MNITIISGRLTQDPELRFTQTKKAVCTFSVKVEDGKDKEGNKRVQFVPCVAWEKTASTIAEYFNKGTPIILWGHLSCRVWEKDGTKRYAWEVFVDRFEFVPGNTRKAEGTPDAFAEIEDDAELPF